MWTKVIVASEVSPGVLCQAITAVQVRSQWADTVCRPWFEKNILDPLLAVITASV